MTQYSFVVVRDATFAVLAVGQQTAEGLDLGRIDQDGSAQTPFPFSIFARQNMSFASLASNEFPAAGAGKSFLRSTVRFQFHDRNPFR
jgi:hypothetical protein